MPQPDTAAPPPTAAGISRRGLLAGAAATGAAASLPLAADPADAADAAEVALPAYLPRTRAYPRTPVADRASRHMASRFGYGMTPALRVEMRAAGGPGRWFENQLRPVRVPDAYATGFAGWFPTLGRSAQEHYAEAKQDPSYPHRVRRDIGRWTLLRRTYSRRQVHEVMTEFWCNHLHVDLAADLTYLWRFGYDATIRRHALGRFDNMLQAAIVHPTMLVYLDADLSHIRRQELRNGEVEETERINENLGRELLELHTVGRSAGYTEQDVKNSAYLLTGWTVDRHGTWACTYDEERHHTGSVQVLDFVHANTQRDGRQALRDYLHHLAHHPATAHRIATKLARRFVSDQPSEELVDHLAGVFRDSGTDIKTTLRALIRHPDFTKSVGRKVRTPTEDVAATLRVLGVRIHKPAKDTDAANAVYFLSQSIGQVPFGWGPPDGFPDHASAWSSPARMMGSFRIHNSVSGGWWPGSGATYRTPESWLPQRRIRFDQFVDHLCRLLHGRPSTSRLLGAACLTVDVRPSDVIHRDHMLINWRMPRLLGVLLDTPQHLTR